MDTSQRPIAVDVEPVEAEGDDQGPDGAEQAHVEADGRGRPDHDAVQELTQDDDEEGGEAVDLVRNVDGGGVPRAQDLLRHGRVAEDPIDLLQTDGDERHRDLAADGERRYEQWDVQAQEEGRSHAPESLLGAVVVAGERVDQMRRVGGQSRNEIGADRRAEGANVFVDKDGVVPIHDQEGHDPEDEHALGEVVVVERVHELAEIAPDVPCRCDDELYT